MNSTSPPYTFAGFSTSYRLWVFPTKEIRTALSEFLPSSPDSDTPPPTTPDPERETYPTPFNPLNHPSRERISQFLILPPYQHHSHGPTLYNTMYSHFHTDPHVFEITLEDPNEAFDDLRDYCDLFHLRRNPAFASLTLASTVPADTLRPSEPVPLALLLPQARVAALRAASKLAPRQFARVLELQLLAQVPARHRSAARITRRAASADPHDRRYYLWRLLVKERVFRRNRDQLAQLDAAERVEKVEETVRNVEAEYARLLEGVERRAGRPGWGDAGAGEGGLGREVNGKRRKRVVDEEDEGEDEGEDGADGEEDGEGGGAVAAKRTRVG